LLQVRAKRPGPVDSVQPEYSTVHVMTEAASAHALADFATKRRLLATDPAGDRPDVAAGAASDLMHASRWAGLGEHGLGRGQDPFPVAPTPS